MKIKYKSTDEVHHVLNSHAYSDLRGPEEFPEDYTKDELVQAIKRSIEALEDFEKNWLMPILDELDYRREVDTETVEYE